LLFFNPIKYIALQGALTILNEGILQVLRIIFCSFQ
jgi:hypothetical protein